MAETIIYNTVTELLKKLVSMAKQEIKQVRDVKNEVDKLEKTVTTIRAVLDDAEERKATNQAVEDWLEKLYDAFYDADDLLDDFSTEVFPQQKWLKKVRNFFSSSNPFAFKSKMAREIKAIRERLDAIAKDKENLHLTERPIENSDRETHSFVHAESVIGRDADKKLMLKLVLDSNVEENVSVVAIVGIGGSGKTALAQLIFNDEEVTKYFEPKMWVCVSEPFDVKLITQKIIGSEASKDSGLEELQNSLREKINGKRYLLVLDDVWNESRVKWLELIELLKGGYRGSKILLTTRNELVANVSGAHSWHVLQRLSEEDSWSLFKKMAFQNVEGLENTRRVEIGEQIAQKCKGVPLAIRAIGSLLFSKDTDDEWLFFKNNDLSKIDEQGNNILPILKLSYHHLPSHLKGCFSFCSLYVKDEEIDKSDLIQLWIAHGFIRSCNENQQLEDIGNLYFIDLLRRSLFQDVRRDEWGDITSCKMHDLVHDVAKSVVRPKSSVVNSNAQNITKGTRHLSLHLSGENPTHLFRANKLRTLRMKDISRFEMDQVFEKIDSTFKRLRVLDMGVLDLGVLDMEKMAVVPSNISMMKHLRYLSLSDSKIESLPSSISKLQNLQTLKLSRCERLKQLPEEIKELVNLRHLELDWCDSLTGMPCGLGELTCLVTLTRFVVDSYSRLSELQNLNNLRDGLVIQIRRQREDSSSCGYLKKVTTAAAEGRMQGTNYLEAKQYLKRLELEFDGDEDNGVLLESLRPHPNLKELKIQGYGGVSFQPSWMMVDKIGLFSSFLPNLVTIHMWACERCKHLPLLGQLPSLQFLSLVSMKSLEYMEDKSSSGSGSGREDSVCSSSSSSGGAAPTPTFFPSLKTLRLLHLPELKGWWRSQAEAEATTTLQDQQQQHLKKLPSFPSLSQLTIRNCPNLASMPILQPCLQQLELRDVSKKVVEEELKMTLVSPTPTPPTDTLATSSSSSSLLFPPLSNLKSLSLLDIDDLVTLPEESFLSLTSLESLEIKYRPKLTSPPDWMRQLTALQQLTYI